MLRGYPEQDFAMQCNARAGKPCAKEEHIGGININLIRYQ